MLTQLYLGSDLPSRLTAINSFRQKFQQILDGSTTPITIEQVRDFQKSLSFANTSSDLQYHLILEAQTLTLPAQHALLKLLEEPPLNTQLILTADKQNSLLQTITSRCQITKLKDTATNDETLSSQFLSNIAKGSYSQLITYAAQLKNDPLPTLISTINKLRSTLYITPKPKRASAITLLDTAISDLNTNVNKELILEHLLFRLKALIQ